MLPISYEELQVWFETCGYTPSPEQEPVHRALLEPRANDEGPVPTVVIMTGGEQSGKSRSAGEHAFARWQVDAIIWLVGERYADCEKEFQYIRDSALRVGMDAAGIVLDYSRTNDPDQSLHITFRCSCPGTPHRQGHIIKTLSSQDVTKLAREAPDGIVMCEPGRQTYEAFLYAVRRVVPHTGWLLVTGTLEGSNSRWFADLWRRCRGPNGWAATSINLPSFANRSIYPGGENDPKFRGALQAIRKENPMEAEEEIAERFYGIPRKVRGLVFSEFRRELHVQDFGAVPGLDVLLWVDPGYLPSAYAVLFVQIIGGQIRIFDELYLHSLVNDEVIDIVLNHEAFSSVSHVVLDVAAGAHAGAQGSAYETWAARLAGRRITISGQKVWEEDGRNRTHDKLRVNPLTGEPWMVFAERCKMTVWEFEEGYRLRERSNGMIGSDTPIDKDNHSIKAIAYGIVDRWGLTDVRFAPPTLTFETRGIDRAFQRPAQFSRVGARR